MESDVGRRPGRVRAQRGAQMAMIMANLGFDFARNRIAAGSGHD